MRVLCLYKPLARDASTQPSPEHYARMSKYVEDSFKSGVLLATEGFSPSPNDVRVRLVNGELSVTDGPFTEAKEIIGGFAILKVRDRQDAIRHCKEFLEVAGGGESEIHELPERSPSDLVA